MKNELDILLKEALHAQSEDVLPPGELLSNVKREAERRKKEKNEMNFKMKKLVAIAAALCLITVTCYAAVEMNIFETHSAMETAVYEELVDVNRDAGINAKYVEAFSNGFVFECGGVNVTQERNSAGEGVGEEIKGINIIYANEAGNHVALFVEPGTIGNDSVQVSLTEYSSDTYKFVPSDYELSEEDKTLMEEGDFFISYGSEGVEIKEMENYRWEDSGLVYCLIASDCGLGEDALAAMAQEIMGE